MSIYKTPFSAAYWKEACASLHNIRSMIFAALMIALCIVLSISPLKISVGENLSVSISFLARALCALVYGPVGALVFGAAEDTLSFLFSRSAYPYFPGYMLTTMLGCLWYALFFYRCRITVARIAIVKLITNVQNVFLGSLWSYMLGGQAYLYYMTTSAVKNALYYPIQVLLLFVLFQAVLPILTQMKVIPDQLGGENRIRLI